MATRDTAQSTRKSFLLYKDFYEQLKEMTVKQAGIYLNAIYAYQHNTDYEINDPVVKFALKGVVAQFKRDDDKYKETCAKRSVAGIKGAKQKLANAGKRKHKLANQAERDRDSDSDIKKNSDYSDEFEEAWVMYGCKGNKPSASRFWKKLNQTDHAEIIKTIPNYHITRPEKQFRADFSTWINPTNKKWQDTAGEDTFIPFRENGKTIHGEGLCNGLNRKQHIEKYGRLV